LINAIIKTLPGMIRELRKERRCMKRRKRIFAIVMACALAFCSSSVAVKAEDTVIDKSEETGLSGKCGDNAYWSLSDSGTLTISGTGKMDDFSVEFGTAELGTRTKTDAGWADDAETIEKINKIIVEEGITYIGRNAFYECTNVEELVLSEGVTEVGGFACWYCNKLKSIKFPSTLKKIGDLAFGGCPKLESIELPNDLEDIGFAAFQQCTGLTSIIIPISVVIGKGAFDGTNFTNIVITKGDGIGFAYNTENYNRTPWYVAQGNNPTIVIDDDIEYIGAYTFYRNKALTELRLPSSLIGIGEGAFYSCTNLKEVVIPCGVTIKDDTFIGCKYIDKKHYDCDGNGVCENCSTKFSKDVIKGKCQIPYGQIVSGQSGYLIGLESTENPRQKYRYELLILDCTKLMNGEDAWIYTTGDNTVDTGNAMWAVWQPQYGYYWTLFRVYDNAGNILEQQCYGFQNII